MNISLPLSIQYEIRNREQSLEYFINAVWVKLPADLKHMIFLELADLEVRSLSKKQLSALSVMSQTFCRIFRPALFSSLFLESLDDLRNLYSVLTNPISTWLTDHILDIYLFSTDSSAQPSLMRSPIFMALLRHMRTLHKLDIHEGSPLDLALPRSLTYRPLHALWNLQVLQIGNSSISTFSSTLRFFGYLPSLCRIELFYVCWLEDILEWTPYVCNSDFQKIETITAKWLDKKQSPMLPFWIFTAASTHYQHFRRRQLQVNFSDLAQLPRQGMMKFAPTFKNILLAQTPPQDSDKSFNYTFQRQCQQEGTSPWLIS